MSLTDTALVQQDVHACVVRTLN
eukprot:COSAG02_NODE_21186_length_798_cov_8.775393_1_plen_22_part_01